jgi:competence protein ComGC
MALNRIKRSAGSLGGQGLAIGGLVTGYIGIVLAIIVIPMMLAVAIPNFVKARNTALTNACVNNLREIDTAKQQWALEHKKEPKDIPAESDLVPYLKTSHRPQCPAGGTYNLNSVAEPPTCSNPNHKLR